MYDKEKLREIDERVNKGVRDLINTKDSVNGVFELDGEFSSGYHIYVPYGISADLAEAIEASIIALKHQSSEMQKVIDTLNLKKDEPSAHMATSLGLVKAEFEVRIKVLRAFMEIPQSVQ